MDTSKPTSFCHLDHQSIPTHCGITMSVLPPNPESPDQGKSNRSLHHIFNYLSNILSSLYALILVASFTALTAAQIVNFPAKHHQLQISNLLVYLLLISIVFLLYVFIYLTRSSSIPRIWSHHKSHGSAFLRQGAIVFGLGTVVYALVEFTSTFQVFRDSPCNDTNHLFHSLFIFLFAIFVILQSFAIVMYPRLNIRKFPLVAKFGLMHLVVTNVIIWIHFIVKESLHELVEAEEHEMESHHDHGEDHHHEKRSAETYHEESWGNNSCIVNYLKKLVEEHHGECRQEEHFDNFLGGALIKASPYLFAFIIEFSLIGATVFYATWCHVGMKPSSEATPKMIENPHPKDFISKIDWSHSLSGFLLGIFIALVNFSNLGIFFAMVNSEEMKGDEFMSGLTNTLLNILGIMACIFGLIRIQMLDHKAEEEENGLDLSMLNVSGFFMYFYACLTVVVGFNTNHNGEFTELVGNKVLMVTNGLIEMLFVTLQITFLANLLEKINTTKTECLDRCQSLYDGCKPGRQAVMFLILLNISQWIIATFELQKSQASPWERSFYGFLPWVILQRISLPLCIFFRFHSAVIAIDCWKNAYKRE